MLTRIRPGSASVRAVTKCVLLWMVLCSPLVFGLGDPERPGWTLLTSVTAITLALVVSRTRPSAASCAVLIMSVIDWRLFLAASVLSYRVGRRRSVATTELAGFAASLALGVSLQVIAGADLYTWLTWLAGGISFALFPVLGGSFRRLQVELVRAGWDRADHLEREQKIVAEQARQQERSRVAQDMHDSLGHELSLIALRAGALEVAGELDEQYRTAAAQLREGVSTAAERLHEIIWLLRDDAESAPLQPSGERIQELVERAADSGFPVVLDVQGDHSDVAPMQYRAAYRVVQESLTNAAKHAVGVPVEVQMCRASDEVVVTIRNGTNPVRAEKLSVARGGRGLTGLRERVGLAGGILHAGPTRDGGFEVVARLPVLTGQVLAAVSDIKAVPPDAPSSTRFRDARRRSQKTLALAVGVPMCLVVAVAGILMALYARDSVGSRLAPEAFVKLQLQSSRTEISDQIPDHQVPERRDEAGPAPPSGTTCEYYRSAAGIVPAAFDVYRLCFGNGHLVAKDVLPPVIR